MYVKGFMDGKEEIESLQDRITGRFSCETIKNKEGEVLVKANHMITPKRAARIMKEGVDNITGGAVEQVKIRTILSCKCKVGVCAKCYGANMATGEPVQVGESIGIIAAQSIGEPGTQLTMRTFHTGGVAHRVFLVSRSFLRQESRKDLLLSLKSRVLLQSMTPRRRERSS